MKQLSKMMLAAVASVALAAPAFAWDFNASGTSSAYFNSTSTTASSTSNTVSSGGVTSASSSLKLASSQTDGDKTLSLSYTLDYDGNLDETIALSGSSKVGKWTASGDVSYARNTAGCYATDNGSGSTTAATSCGTTGAGQTGEDATAVTVTDGTMTIKLGEAGHLSDQNVSSGSTAGGSISMDGAGMDESVGAVVGSFHGVSLGYKVNDTTNVTVAYQSTADQNDLMGEGAFQDGESGFGTTGFGLSVSASGLGPATVGFTFASASSADPGTATVAPTSLSTSSSTMGLGVKIDLGDIDPFISYGSYSAVGASTENGLDATGMELGMTYAMGSDSVVFYYGTASTITTATGTAGEPLARTGMELGYNTTVGPASLKVGYGTTTKDQTGGTEGYSVTDIEVAMSYSF